MPRSSWRSCSSNTALIVSSLREINSLQSSRERRCSRPNEQRSSCSFDDDVSDELRQLRATTILWTSRRTSSRNFSRSCWGIHFSDDGSTEPWFEGMLVPRCWRWWISMVWAKRTDLVTFSGDAACVDSASDAADLLVTSVAEIELDPSGASQTMQSPSLAKVFLIRGAMVTEVCITVGCLGLFVYEAVQYRLIGWS